MKILQERFFDVLLPLPFSQAFSYKNRDLNLKKGDIVKVPFGKKKLYGVVIQEFSQEEFLLKNKIELSKIKEIEEKNGFLRIDENLIKFIDEISSYNMVVKGLVLKALIGFLNSDKVKESLIAKSCLKQEFVEKNVKLKKLSQNQEEIAKKILQNFQENKNIALIDGVTGSGKTEIYFKIINQFLKEKDAQILIMLPEIALTSQILSRFETIFGLKPALWHSKISKKDKREIFYGIANNDVKIIIGARSSLLLPFKNLRLIVVDEEHDSSYKQEEIFNFNARDMAILKAKIDNSNVILCSATPSLESFANAKSGKYQYFSLDEKFNKKQNQVNIIDLKREKLEKNCHISSILRKEIAENFALKRQSLLFLNRRGYAPIMLCKACGEKVDCKNCSANLVHHKSMKNSICHYCGYVEKFNDDCKKCDTKNSIINIGVGVEKIKEEVQDFLPQARIAMINSDNLSNFNEIDEIIKKISDNEIDIIIGTQMISKGYDFSNLTLIGIIDADSGFYSVDLKAGEKSFQLLSQVLGRAGRKNHQGQIFIQTYNSENFILKKLIENDKKGFYEFELKNRKNMNLPPFAKMANISFDSLEQDLALNFAKKFVKNVPFSDSIEIFGPAPAKLFRHKNRYFYNVFVKVDKKINLQKLIFDVKNRLDIINQVNIKVDIDP